MSELKESRKDNDDDDKIAYSAIGKIIRAINIANNINDLDDVLALEIARIEAATKALDKLRERVPHMSGNRLMVVYRVATAAWGAATQGLMSLNRLKQKAAMSKDSRVNIIAIMQAEFALKDMQRAARRLMTSVENEWQNRGLDLSDLMSKLDDIYTDGGDIVLREGDFEL